MTNHIHSSQFRSTDPDTIDELVSIVGEDPTLEPVEKETIIRWGKVDDRAFVYTEEGSITRRLLRHPLFEVESMRHYRKSSPAAWKGDADDSADRITGVQGHLPIGVLKVQSASRADQSHCKVISKEGLVYP